MIYILTALCLGFIVSCTMFGGWWKRATRPVGQGIHFAPTIRRGNQTQVRFVWPTMVVSRTQR